MMLKPLGDELSVPVVPLSLFYGVYFAAVGVVLPFLGLYLQSLQLTAVEIAQLLAALSFVRMISPPLWAVLADRQGQFLYYALLASWLAALCALGLWWFTTYWSLLVLITILGFFWHAALPPMESLTLRHIESQPTLYGHIRLWGSVGFVVAVVGAGWLIDRYGQLAFLLLTSLLFFSIALVAHMNREAPRQTSVSFTWSLLGRSLARPLVWWVLAIGLLIQMAHAIYYSFYSILLDELGYSKQAIGWLWSLGVLAEIIWFAYFVQVAHRLSTYGWFVLASLLSIVRWLLIAFYAHDVVIMLIAQLLHAVSFAAFHAVMVRWLHTHFVGLQTQAQALYVSTGYGAGATLGTLLAGYAWNIGGGVWAFSLAAMVSLLALLISLKLLMSQQNNKTLTG